VAAARIEERMASPIRDLAHVFKLAFKGWKADNCLSMGAALACYSLLSIGPLLVLVITLAGLVIGYEKAHELLLTQLSGLLGDTGAQGVRTVLESASKDDKGLVQTAVSFALLVVGATTVFGELQDDLNRIWKCKPDAKSGIMAQVRKRLLSFGLIVVIGFLLLISLVVSAAISYMGGQWFGGNEQVARMLELGASLLVMTGLFALTFKILPERKIPWSDVAFGAFVTAVLFSIGKYLIGLYIGKSAIASDFGAAGTVVVVIVWVYYSSQIFFLGAEFTRAWSLRREQSEAANDTFRSEPLEMEEVARHIVHGGVLPGRTPRPST
jgi:membrane protein